MIGGAILAVDQAKLDLGMRIADRHLGLRQSFRVRAEHDRPGLRRAVGIGDRRLRQRRVDRLHQALAHRRRAHADEFDAAEIGAGEQVLLAQHHGDHRRHGGEPRAAVALDRLDIGARGKLRQQHDGGMRRARELGERERVHVIERRGDQIAVAVEPGREPRLHHPDVALVREHDAFWRTGRARRIEEHRGLARCRNDGIERPMVQEGVEAFGSAAAEADDREALRAIGPSREIAEQQLGAGVLQDEMDGLARKLEVDRDGNKSRAHDAVVGGEILGAIGGEDRDAVATHQPAPHKRARDAVRHRVELRVAELAR